MAPDPLTSENTSPNDDFDARCTEWISEMSGGNEQALGDLYDATLGKVFGVAVRIVGDSATAEDVVTDVYYEAWNSAASYDRQRGRPITWLLTICRNRALDEYRRAASSARKIEAATAASVPGNGAAPDDLLEMLEQGHEVHALLMTIPVEDRQLLALAFFRGLSHQQIAGVTGMPLGTVKSRIRRALNTLGEAAQRPDGH